MPNVNDPNRSNFDDFTQRYIMGGSLFHVEQLQLAVNPSLVDPSYNLDNDISQGAYIGANGNVFLVDSLGNAIEIVTGGGGGGWELVGNSLSGGEIFGSNNDIDVVFVRNTETFIQLKTGTVFDFGSNNLVSGSGRIAVLGSENSVIDSDLAFIFGEKNVVNNANKIFLSGRNNQINGDQNKILANGLTLSGYNNFVTCENSIITGRNNFVGGAKANAVNAEDCTVFGADCFAFSNGKSYFSSGKIQNFGDAQKIEYIAKGTLTGQSAGILDNPFGFPTVKPFVFNGTVNCAYQLTAVGSSISPAFAAAFRLIYFSVKFDGTNYTVIRGGNGDSLAPIKTDSSGLGGGLVPNSYVAFVGGELFVFAGCTNATASSDTRINIVAHVEGVFTYFEV